MRGACLLLAALAGLVVSALTVSACRGVVIPDEEDYKPAADSFCQCWGSFGVYDDQDDCTRKVTKRLEETEGKVLSDWLMKYVNDCSGQCAEAVACYYTLPVCSFAACTTDKECCSYDGGAGTCNEMGECALLGP